MKRRAISVKSLSSKLEGELTPKQLIEKRYAQPLLHLQECFRQVRKSRWESLSTFVKFQKLAEETEICWGKSATEIRLNHTFFRYDTLFLRDDDLPASIVGDSGAATA